MEKPRQIAARVLLQREKGREFLENLLEPALAGSHLAGPDRALAHELACGVVRWQATLDHLIARKTGGRAQKPGLRILLRLGLYQLFWLDRIPDHAAIHETVELARQLGYAPQAGFVNAVLRGYARERETTAQLLADLKQSDPALGWSHPAWLCERWERRWGAEKLRALLEWNNTPPRTWARLNTLKTDAGKLLAQWRDENVEYDFFLSDWTGENLVFELKSHPPLAALPSFQQGLFYVQEPGTLLAVTVLDPQPGETVLDLCAAPGGKTSFLAQRMNNSGRIVATDPSPDRLRLVEENCRRLGVTCVQTLASSAFGVSLSALQFDRILIDAPCSNTGVMRRRVDLRWRLRPEEIERLRGVQLGLVRRAAPLLRPGGTLVYSTCSLEPEENEDVARTFAQEFPAFRLDFERTLLPFADGVDGAYVARFRRAATPDGLLARP